MIFAAALLQLAGFSYLFASSKVNSLLPLPVGCVGGRTIFSTAALASVAKQE
jgi:hypothetical protein